MSAARVLMVQGTASGVGKSWTVTALCRLMNRRGYSVAPFKAQNMSNNAAVTLAGEEIGRAQAVQAFAAGMEPDARMNPVLLKPLGATRSDVVVMGSSRPELASVSWAERKGRLWNTVTSALDSLREDVDWVVIEGAGSPAESNLRSADLVNMSVALHVRAPVILVADIDRGGAFAAALGTWHLLSTEERRLLRGFFLNRFRGDRDLLGDAPADLERRTGVPVLGVVPWVGQRLPEEDAATLERQPRGEGRIGAIRLPRIANFDDVLPVEADPAVGIRWVEEPEDLEGVSGVIIPGTRNTAADLVWLHRSGIADALGRCAGAGKPILGLCGGLQMLGIDVADPDGVEGLGSVRALGLLPLRTALVKQKCVRRVRVRWGVAGDSGVLQGYEIHHGNTTATGPVQVFMHPVDEGGPPLGYRKGAVCGTYVHGCLSDPAFRRAWLRTAGLESGTVRDGLGAAVDAAADALEGAIGFDALLEALR